MARPDLFARVRAHAVQVTPHGTVHGSVGRRDGARVEVDGQWLCDFSSQDHLGLSSHFAVVNALQDAVAREGVGSASPHGPPPRHAACQALEQELATWLGQPRALLCGNALLANLAVQQSLLDDEADVCVQDTLNHASLLDSTHLAGARLRRYPHLDAEGALRQLRAMPGGAALLATEAVFALEGDSAPLRALSLVARQQQALLYVDDGHGLGLLGEQGCGSVAAAGLGSDDVPLQQVALDKALGCAGVVLLGDAALLDHIAGTAAATLAAHALHPAWAAAALEAVRLTRREQWRRDKLQDAVALFRAAAGRHGLSLSASASAIQPVLCGSDADTLAMAHALQAAGYRVEAVVAPQVPAGRARLRVCLTALHAASDIEGLVAALASARDALQRPAAAIA